MQSTDDSALLRQYAENHSDEAFAALVTRHINLVYSVALRHLGDPHEAEEVTQAVFILLAKKALQLRHDQALSSWLFQATRLTAGNFVRGETRRHRREQEAHMQSVLNESGADAWPGIAPLLDDAVAGLSEKDRRAIVLRFYEGRNLREVGAALGASEDAAEKRVHRAVEKLRVFFAKRGVTIGASGLAVALSANAVQAAPAGLAATVSTAAALAGTTLATATVATAIKTIAMTTLQKTLITATIAAAVGTGIYEARQVSSLRTRVQTLQQQQAPLAEQLTQLKIENESLSNEVVQARDAQALSKAQLNELLKLRGQAGMAQADSRELARIKSTLAQQAGTVPDYLTNAMAIGMGTAEKWKKKDAQARLGRMKKILNLTDDQEKAISDIMQKHIQSQSQMGMDLISGKIKMEQLTADQINQEAEIKALFTPEQLAAYPEYQQAEKLAAADGSAKSDASRIADDFNLTKEQQEQIRAAFYQMNLNEPDKALNEEAIAAAKRSGNYADSVNMGVELQKAQLEEKINILGNILTPEQINSYREEQLNQINLGASAVKMFFPKNAAGTTN